MDDLIDRNDATALAALVARREVTPSELLQAAIARADATAALNHTPIRFDDVARARAAAPLGGPFAGVPFLLKDIGQEYAGQKHTAAAAPPTATGWPSRTALTCKDASMPAW